MNGLLWMGNLNPKKEWERTTETKIIFTLVTDTIGKFGIIFTYWAIWSVWYKIQILMNNYKSSQKGKIFFRFLQFFLIIFVKSFYFDCFFFRFYEWQNYKYFNVLRMLSFIKRHSQLRSIQCWTDLERCLCDLGRWWYCFDRNRTYSVNLPADSLADDRRHRWSKDLWCSGAMWPVQCYFDVMLWWELMALMRVASMRNRIALAHCRNTLYPLNLNASHPTIAGYYDCQCKMDCCNRLGYC